MSIAWNALNTPLVSQPNRSLKDPALIFHDGWWRLVCSSFDQDNHSQLIAFQSRDLATWSGPLWSIGTGSDGYCSPDIIRNGNEFIMTFQSWDAIPPRQSRNQLFYATSTDAETWSEPKPLAKNLTAGVRAIDAALAQHNETWYLIYKEAQTPRLATAEHIDGPWTLLPAPFDVWAENAQFLFIDGTWHVLATILDHKQAMCAMKGDPGQQASWSTWTPFSTLSTPIRPGFNEATPANASCIWDHRQEDGMYYRPFCAAQNPTDNNWGYELGIARSSDLLNWHLPH